MSRLSQLTEQLNKQTTEKAKHIEMSLDNELRSLEQSLKAELQQSHSSITNAITSHEQRLKEQINKTLAYKTMTGGLMGLLLAIMVGLGIFNLYLAKNITKKQMELAEIQQNIDQSPIEQRLLAKIKVTEWAGKNGLVVIPKSKAEWSENQAGDKALFINK